MRKASEERHLNTLNPNSPFVLTAKLEAVGESTKDTAADLDLPWLNALRTATLTVKPSGKGLPTPTAKFGPWTLKGEPR